MKRTLLHITFAFIISGLLNAQTYEMDANNGQTISTCSGTFYDSGGSGSDYTNNENYTVTFMPATSGAMLSFNFTSFYTESGYDYLYVFDGPNTSSTMIASYNGALGTATITATNPSGALTFQFISDNSKNHSGWTATISCSTPAPTNDNCSGAISLFSGLVCNKVTGTLANATVSTPASTCSTNEDVWYSFVASSTTESISVSSGSDMDAVIQLYSGTCGSLTSLQCQNSTGVGAIETLTYTGLTVGTTYYVRVFNYSATNPTDPIFDICVTSTGGQTYYQGTNGQQGTYISHCMENITNGATSYFVDDGGATGNYSSNINSIYRVFCPNTIGHCVRATVTAMDISDYNWWGTCYDYLSVQNGPTQNSTILWRGCGTKASPIITTTGSWNGGVWTSSDPSGCLSFRFFSDDTDTYSGWNIALTCETCTANQDTFADCDHSIPTCGNTSFSGSSNGPGISSSCTGGCLLGESYATWYFFEIATSGTLSFEIDPIVSTEDYDFALYQASGCSNLPAPIRCSYASETGSTGLLSTETDESEGATGNSFVKSLNVTAGEVYILNISAWTAGASGYDINFSLGSGVSFRDCDEIGLPVELLSFTGECKNNHSELIWQTASETNCDYFAIMKSTNNTVWKTVGYVMAAGNSNTPRNYFFTDPEENDGSVYYKLKTVDFDGSSEYGPLLAVTCGEKENLFEVSILDNNEEGFTTVNFTCVEGDDYTVTLMSMNGQLVFRQTLEAASNMVSVDIPTAALNSGVYSLSITSAKSVYGTKVFIH